MARRFWVLTLFDVIVQVSRRGLKRGNQSNEQHGDNCNKRCKGEDAQIERRIELEFGVASREKCGERPAHKGRRSHSGRAAHDPNQQALGEQLLYQAVPRRAHRQAGGQLPLSCRSARC